MAKYRDTGGMGKSVLCPRQKYEPPKDRHLRRKNYNLNNAKAVRQFCETKGIELHISNRGHHWKAQKGKKLIEWWPSTAKAVINKNWGRGIHVHDYAQFIKLLGKKM